MINQSNRVKQLDQAKDVIADLETELDAELFQARSRVADAGDWIQNDEMYHEYLEEAMGRIAGEAIRNGYDDIAATAAELVDNPESDDS